MTITVGGERAVEVETVSMGQRVVWWPEPNTGWNSLQGVPAVVKKTVGDRMQIQARRWNGDPVLIWTTADRLQPETAKK